ncbi:MAG: DUF2267 domain-containing protein [Caulobacterales bacterium]
MSTGLPAFDRTVQETNRWLKDLEARLDGSRPHAYAALKATLWALRDRLPPETAMHFAAQLPMLLRGAYTEGWSLTDKPTGERTAETFDEHISERLPPQFPFDAETVARAVFQTVRDQMDLGEIDKVLAHLPKPIRELWVEPVI